MAAAIWIVRKVVDPTSVLIDGIDTVVINADDAGTEADTLGEAVAQCVVAGHPINAGYFDTADLALTDMGTDEDIVMACNRRELIA